MSGPISVPLGMAAFFVSNDIAKLLLALTAIASFVFTAYWIWRVERGKVIGLEQSLEQARLRPKLELKFDRSLPGCVEITGAAPARCITVRVLPSTPSRVDNCKGQLLSISESVDGMHWDLTNYIDALDLRWTHRTLDPVSTPMRITKGVQQTLDVFAIGEKENILRPSTLSYPRPLPNFGNGKWFKFDIKVSGDDQAENTISLRVKLTGTWNNFIVEKI